MRLRSGVAILVCAASALAAPAALARGVERRQQSHAYPAGPAHRAPECPTVDVALLDTVDSRTARAGDRFRFVTLDTIYVHLKPIPRGTEGAGFVETVEHARGNGRSGYLVLDARYLALAHGPHVPASFAPGSDGQSAGIVRASNTDAPGFLGYTPLVAATSMYNILHHGKEAALVRGTREPLIVGDGLSAGTCAVSWMP